MPKDFVHLHLHSEFSLLDGCCRIPDALQKAHDLGMGALALTDHGVMYGILSFYRTAIDLGVKPILGSEVYVAQASRKERSGSFGGTLYHLVLLAENNEGYRNLMRIVTRGFTEGFYYRPRVDKEVLRDHHQGIIALSGCLKGEVSNKMLGGDREGAVAAAREYQGIFGEENFYLEIQDQGLEEQKRVNPALVEISRDESIPLIATNDVHYVNREDSEAHDVLLCIQTGSVLADESRLKFSTEEFYLRSRPEMMKVFPDFPEALTNTAEVASRCNVEIPLNKVYLPKYDVPEDYTLDSFLEKVAWEGLRRRFPEPEPESEKRLAEELEVIKGLGFSGYFLIVWDFVKEARSKGIRVGPGRGSAAGSLVAYALSITNINPLKYGLLFERFLNPGRIALPDIDIDFSHERRQEVIDYVTRKYGKERVAQIITFSSMKAKAAARDAGRVLDIPYNRVDRIAKMIPEVPLDITVDEALSISHDLREEYERDKTTHRLIDIAKRLEGLVRQDSVHAAGVVIADDELTNYSPLQQKGGPDKEIVTQYDMYDLQRIGLLKVDLLGLRNQTLLEKAVESIRENYGVDLDIDKVPMDDEKTFDLIQQGETVGVFQLASQGMRSLMKDLLPTKFEEIIALIALYRPGPLRSGMVQDFVDHKHGRKKITYSHPLLEEILAETYGVIVYQEQVMQIGKILAGFSLEEGDELRHAMSKKKPEIIVKQKKKFIDGARKNNIQDTVARRIYDLIEKFGGYGFNKSHSTAYAVVSYQTAYLKAHYPVEYMAALLTTVMDNQDRMVEYINECRKMGIDVNPPDVNRSDRVFTPNDGYILFGLSAVRNVGDSVVALILDARRKGGPFKSFLEYCERVDGSVTNKKVMESLISGGAFDSIEPNRSLLLHVYADTVDTAQRRKRDKELGQYSLFGDGDDAETDQLKVPPQYQDMPKEQLLAREKEMLGVYVSDHPLLEWKDELDRRSDIEISQITDELDGNQVTLCGMVNRVRKLRTRRGDQMAIANLEDLSGGIELVVFPSVYQKFTDLLEEDSILQVKGTIDVGDRERNVKVKEITDIYDNGSGRSTLEISSPVDKFDNVLIKRIKKILMTYQGNTPVILRLVSPHKKTIIKLGETYYVEPQENLVTELKSILGEQAVRIT